MPSKEELLKALSVVNDPELGQDLVSLGMIKDLQAEGDRVSLTLELTTPACPMKRKMQDDIRAALATVPGVERVDIRVTSRVRSATGEAAGAGEEETPLPQVKNIIAVGAGKGGVGKSTVAVYAALSLARQGARVGLLDADLYGPSIPRMLGVADCQPDVIDGRLQPVAACGLAMMSIGLLIDPDKALAWRGPLIHKALQQLLTDTDWGELDYLVVDLPPGTGDVHLSLVQLVPLTGAVIVSTPQQVALQDAVKAAALYRSTEIEILGLVENMSSFTCPHCGKATELFGRGTVEKAAAEIGAPYLGDLPLNLSIRASGDDGRPDRVLDTDAAAAEAIARLAANLAGQISVRLATKPAPQILGTRKS
ncbi:MAG: Mrp/NBP35 family ATP-binding protein [Planctomycetes bacterium]|nr:Mrp/NBP35 family ATP-binding protein [Planctomycetota bacterium]